MTNRRLFPLFTLILGCIGSFWYFIENIDRTFIFGKDGLVPPTEQKHKIQLVLDKPVTTKLVPVTLRLHHVIKCPHWNHDDFAPVDTPTVDVKDDELTARVFSDTISPDHTLIKIFNPKTFYNLCDRLIVQIIARDRNGKFKTHGGDLFRLKIFTAKPYSATSEDKLIDFKNGTYLAYFTVRWSGQVKVQVKLIHPVEILQEMQLNMQGMFGANHTFIGIFSSEASGAEEKRLCRYFPTLTGPICNLSNTLSHGPWFCEKPVNSNLTCDDWKFHQMYTKQSFLNFDAHLSPLSLESLKKIASDL